jgi:tyrosinase
MRVEFTLNNSSEANARVLTWAPSPLRLRLLEAPPLAAPVEVTLIEQRKVTGGAVRFSETDNGSVSTQLKLKLPASGESVTVYVRGKFGSPSTENGDVSIVASTGGQILGALPVMVRIRKNANLLTEDERDRFVSAMGILNNRGQGPFAEFNSMHIEPTLRQSHGNVGFLAWHRAYLLDLERELQAIDPSVALPYWRYDRPAPALFTPEFIGITNSLGTVEFSTDNPLYFWAAGGDVGVKRRLKSGTMDPASRGAPVRTEGALVALKNFATFRDMEGDPHGFAHTTHFSGSISDPRTSAKDPLFFLLHCNVDRVWALWQFKNNRLNPDDKAAYDNTQQQPKGHNLNDTLWPWDGDTKPPRPATAPGGTFARSACVAAPGDSPLARDMIDYLGQISIGARLGFAYDDVSP